MVSVPPSLRAVAEPWATGAVRAELESRRDALVAGLGGDVLELRGPGSPGGAPPVDARYDHVVSAGWLAAAADLEAAIAQLWRWVGDDGWLHVIEPSIGVGAAARVQRLTASVGYHRTGWRVDRDIPDGLRRAGFVVTDLERFSMPVPSVVLRPWVSGRARRRHPIPFDAPIAGMDAGRSEEDGR